MKIKPLFNRILAKKIKKQQKSACGIEIIQEEEQIEKAQVLKIGTTAQNCGINIGDTIFFEPHVTAELTLGSDEMILICVEDILAIESLIEIEPTNCSIQNNSNPLYCVKTLENQQSTSTIDSLVDIDNKEVL